MTSLRWIRFLGLFLLLTTLLASCQNQAGRDLEPSDIESMSPDGALVIYWHALSAPDAYLLSELIDQFNADNPWGITVVSERQKDLETIQTRVLSNSEEKLPALIMTQPGLTASYAAQEIAVSLQPYIASERWGLDQTALDDFFPGVLGKDTFQKETLAFPFRRALRVLYYNTEWLEELGYEDPPQDWEEFYRMACAASIPAENKYGFEFGMDQSLYVNLLATQGGTLLNRDATAYTLGGDKGKATLQFLQNLIQEGCAFWQMEQESYEDLSAGQILFTIDTTDRLSTYRRRIAEGASFAWGISALPHTTPEPLIGVQGPDLMILRSTPRLQLAAWVFIKWLSEPEQQSHWAQRTHTLPLRRSALADMESYFEARPQSRQASELLDLETVTTEPDVINYAACGAEIERMLYAITAGEHVEDWLTATRSRCNHMLVQE